MPWKVWAELEPVDAAPFQQYLQEQVVARFTTDAQRSTLLPTPLVGQLSSLETEGVIDVWHEGYWQPAGARLVSWAKQASKGYSGGLRGSWQAHNFSNSTRYLRPGYTWDIGKLVIPVDGFYRFSFSFQGTDTPCDFWAKMTKDDFAVDGNVAVRQLNAAPAAVPTGGNPAGGFSQVHFCTAGEAWGVSTRMEDTPNTGGTVQLIDSIYTVEHLAAATAPSRDFYIDVDPAEGDPPTMADLGASAAHLLDS